MTEPQNGSKMDEKAHQEASMLGRGRNDQQEGAKMPQYLVTLAATIIVISGGTTIGWSSPAMAHLLSPNSTNSLTMDEGSWAGSLLAIGAFMGALPAGSFADLVGRKIAIMSLALPLLVSWLSIFMAKGAGLIYLGRLVGGIGLGAICTVVPMYIGEIAEGSVRGILGASFQLMLVVGILYAYIMGAIVSYESLSIVCGIIPIVFLIAFIKAPESPMYLLKKDKRHQAENALLLLRGSKYNIFKELHSMENELTGQTGAKVSFFRVASSRAGIKGLIICLGLMVFQQLSGINIVIFYSESIFKDAGSSLKPEVATIIVGFAQVAATGVSAVLIDKTGRTILLKVSALIMAICLWALGLYFLVKDGGNDVSSYGWVPLLSVVVYIIIFAIGFGPIPWMMTAEVLPPEIKGVGTSIAVALNWCLAFTVTKSFQPLLLLLGTAKTYWCFGFICLVGLIFVITMVIETKGKSLSQIQDELSGKSKPRANVI